MTASAVRTRYQQAFQEAFQQNLPSFDDAMPPVCYALVDAGQNSSYPAQLEQFDDCVALFDGTPEQALREHGPWLLRVGAPRRIDQELFQWLKLAMQGDDAVLWLWSHASLDRLATHLRRQLDWALPDSRVALMRYYDATVFPHFWSVLDPAQQRTFSGPVLQWWNWRDGHLHCHAPSHADQSATAATNPFPPTLSATQSALIQLPFATEYLPRLLAELRQHAPDNIYFQDRQTPLASMRRAWDAAVGFGLHALPTLNQFCASALAFPDFYHSPEVKAYLQADQNSIDARVRDVLALLAHDLRQIKEE